MSLKREKEIREWCVGDFNSITKKFERRYLRNISNKNEMGEFANLSEKIELIDVALQGKKFSWFFLDGSEGVEHTRNWKFELYFVVFQNYSS